jgi:hypothetical protein
MTDHNIPASGQELARGTGMGPNGVRGQTGVGGSPGGPMNGTPVRDDRGDVSPQMQEFTVVTDLLGCAKHEAVALCQATLESVTPSLGAMLQLFMAEELEAHAALAEYAMQHGFYRPYLDPAEQIAHDLHLASAQPVPDREPLV